MRIKVEPVGGRDDIGDKKQIQNITDKNGNIVPISMELPLSYIPEQNS